MANFDFNDFLNILNDKQRKAVLSCRTEAEFEQVMDDFDIEIPDEMLEMVAGGKGKLFSVLLSGVLATAGVGTAAIATAANAGSNDGAPAVVMEVDHINPEATEPGKDPSQETTVSSASVQHNDNSSMSAGDTQNGKHPGEMGYGYQG